MILGEWGFCWTARIVLFSGPFFAIETFPFIVANLQDLAKR